MRKEKENIGIKGKERSLLNERGRRAMEEEERRRMLRQGAAKRAKTINHDDEN